MHKQQAGENAARVIEWKQIRVALELTQHEFAAELDTSFGTVKRLESTRGWPGVSPRVVTNLQILLTNPYYKALLRDAEVADPFPADVPPAVLYRHGPKCQVDGIPLRSHARCVACTLLAGPGHSLKVNEYGLCPSCAREIENGRRTVRLPNGQLREAG